MWTKRTFFVEFKSYRIDTNYTQRCLGMKKLSLILMVLFFASCTTSEVGRYVNWGNERVPYMLDTKTGIVYKAEEGKWVAFISLE